MSAIALKAYQSRLPIAQWARSYRGLSPLPVVMAAPPTITIGATNAVSTISGTNGVSVTPNDARLTSTGTGQIAVASGVNFYQPTNNSRGNRIRFITNGRRFDIRLQSFSGRGVSIFVDGQLVSAETPDTTNPWSALANANLNFALVDFGADTQSFYMADPAALSGGSGYAVGDEITLSGGTASVPAVVRVTAVSGGVPTVVVRKTPGVYSVRPAGSMTQASTTGSGTGLTLTGPVFGSTRTTAKTRRIEIVLGTGVYFGGLNVDTNVSVQPWPTTGPRLLFAGDSFTDFNFIQYAAGNWAEQTAWLLGLHDSYERVALGGRGYLAGSPLSTDLNSIIGRAPDMLVVALGTNDAAQNQTTLQSTVTANIGSVLAALPNARVAVLTGWTDTGTQSTAIKAGVAALGSNRAQIVDVQALGAYNATVQACSDGLHPPQAEHDALAVKMAPAIGAAFVSMAP